MNMKPTLQLVGNVLCVAQPIENYTDPQIHVHYWPIGETDHLWRETNKDLIGRELFDAGAGCSTYSIKDGGFWRSFELKDGGKTLPIKTDIIPVPAPKTKKPVRWNSGRWEKLLKSGWQIA